MSRHTVSLRFQDRPVCTFMGWDRPLSGCLLAIERLDGWERAQEFLYFNLSEPDLAVCMGLPSDLAHFDRRLAEFGLTIPRMHAPCACPGPARQPW